MGSVAAMSVQHAARVRGRAIRFAFAAQGAWVGAMSRPTDTIAALATPVGTAALAVLRVSGPDTMRLAAAVCGDAPPPRHARHCDYRDREGRLVDDVVCVRFVAPHSYTGEDGLEISCHGNPYIAQRILADLHARGCRPARPGEFTERAFLNGRIDLSQAEAVMDVIHARSERALAVAQQQLRGALGERVQAAVDAVLDVLARVEAYIDFPDEDLPPEDRQLVLGTLTDVQRSIGRLLATAPFGELLRDGVKTVIIGPPNAGKSSLLNRLLGRERALVSAEPGTTRDFIEERIVVGPHCLRLIDTAGLNPSPGPLEELGIQKTLERAEEADLFLIVEEVLGPAAVLPDRIRGRLNSRNGLFISNKCDLPHPGPTETRRGAVEVIEVSALTGVGIAGLVSSLVRLVDGMAPETTEDAIAVSARHASALQEAADALGAAHGKLLQQDASELISSDLRMALSALGEIRGRIDNEEMLDRLFATFCIGK
jgi:tRNA modification GTPase